MLAVVDAMWGRRLSGGADGPLPAVLPEKMAAGPIFKLR